jgi:hypothetical protein
MAITHSGLAYDMVRDLVRAAPPEAGVRRVWVWSKHGHIDPERDYVELSVLHDPLDEATHQRFLSAIVDVLNARYPEVNKFLHTFSLDDGEDFDLDEEIRPGSEEVDLAGE